MSKARAGVWLAVAGLTLAVVVALPACAGVTTGGATATPTATSGATATTAPTAQPSVAVTNTPGGYAVKVYFSKSPASDEDPTKVFPVARVSPTLGVATYSIKQLLAGPTAAEKSAGYYTPWAGALVGPSNCGGADFTITLDHRGKTPAPGVATLQFCRETQIPGELAGVRMEATAKATLLQFSNIKSVVILNYNGDCFDDLSGQNLCLSS